ncbi:unnamed protein product [Musa acuminata var. zebrina]
MKMNLAIFLYVLLLESSVISCKSSWQKLATMESVHRVNVPMYTTLRRTTVVFTMIVEYLLTRQKYTLHVVGSVTLIVLGAFVAGAGDLIFQCLWLWHGISSGLNSFGLMWCNGILCGPILLLWTYFRGDLGLTMNFPYLHSVGFQVGLSNNCWLIFAGCDATFLYTGIFFNTTLNSALTQTMCGKLKDLFTIGLGWLLFGGLPFDVFFYLFETKHGSLNWLIQMLTNGLHMADTSEPLGRYVDSKWRTHKLHVVNLWAPLGRHI